MSRDTPMLGMYYLFLLTTDMNKQYHKNKYIYKYNCKIVQITYKVAQMHLHGFESYSYSLKTYWTIILPYIDLIYIFPSLVYFMLT